MCEQCNERDNVIGERVLAIKDIDPRNNTIMVFGTGVYEGQHVPHWVDLDLLLTTIPDEVKEIASKAVEEMVERFNDPTMPQTISNTALGMGMSAEKAARLLDTYFEDQKKYLGLSIEEAGKVYLRETVAKQFKTPRIRLDSGEYVYGTHCIFGKEQEMQGIIDETVAKLAQKGVNVNVETVPVPEHADA